MGTAVRQRAARPQRRQHGRWAVLALACLTAAPLSAATPPADAPANAPADAPAYADAPSTFDRRLTSFVLGGYDPLTVPVDWYDPVEPVVGGAGLHPAAKASTAVSADAIAAARDWAMAQGSAAFLVSHRGQLVAEHYGQASGRDTRFNPQSMAKTVLAILVGIAIDRGELRSVDQPAADFTPGWRDDARAAITIRHLLTMASGLKAGDRGFGYAITPDNPLVAQNFGEDYLRLALDLKAEAPPGTSFAYNNNNTLLLAHILQQASGQRYAALLSDRLWRPLGLGRAALPLDRAGGMVMPSCCLFSRPVDWMAIGTLLAQRGAWQGRQLVSADWIDAMTSPSPAYPGYGFQVWLGNQRVGGTPDNPPGLVPWHSAPFSAQRMILLNGWGAQRLYVMPDKGLVVLRAGRSWPPAWDDAILPNIIWEGTSSE